MLSGPPCKDRNSRFTTLPLKPLADKNVKNNVIFLTHKVISSLNFSIASYNQEMRKSIIKTEPANEN